MSDRQLVRSLGRRRERPRRVAVWLPGSERALASRVRLGDGYWARLLGLMGRRALDPEEGLWLIPCSSVHMLFMRTALDVVYLDRQERVLLTIPEMRPWSVRLLPVRGARSALELAPGTLRRQPLRSGDQLEFTAESAAPSGAALSSPVVPLGPSLRSSQ